MSQCPNPRLARQRRLHAVPHRRSLRLPDPASQSRNRMHQQPHHLEMVVRLLPVRSGRRMIVIENDLASERESVSVSGQRNNLLRKLSTLLLRRQRPLQCRRTMHRRARSGRKGKMTDQRRPKRSVLHPRPRSSSRTHQLSSVRVPCVLVQRARFPGLYLRGPVRVSLLPICLRAAIIGQGEF